MNTQIIPTKKKLNKGNLIYLDYTSNEAHKEFCGRKLIVESASHGSVICEYQGKIIELKDDKTDGFFTISA